MEEFHLEVAESTLEDLRERLRRTRFPDAETVDDWSQGVPLTYARELRDHWLHDYDWRTTEAELNALGQHTTEVDGLRIHLLHVPSPVPHARPLVLTHGWPGSVVEFLDVVGPLTDPAAHGGDPADAFHVVVPSLPGYGFSERPTAPGWSVDRIADAWVGLMTRLGYRDWIAHGGDWGAMVTTAIGVRHPAAVAGIHLTMPFAMPVGDPTPEEQAYLRAHARHQRDAAAYAHQQSTRPQGVAYGLADSPVAQATWIIEKFHEWTDHDGDLEEVVSRDRLLDDVMLYWLSNTGGSSARLYWESYRRPNLDPVEVPMGWSAFPVEIVKPPLSTVRARYRDLRLHVQHERGGHFAALERPDAVVDDLRAFARLL